MQGHTRSLHVLRKANCMCSLSHTYIVRASHTGIVIHAHIGSNSKTKVHTRKMQYLAEDDASVWKPLRTKGLKTKRWTLVGFIFVVNFQQHEMSSAVS